MKTIGLYIVSLVGKVINNIYNINREELKTIVELCNSYRLSKEDNAKIIRQYTEYNEEYKKYLDILLDINMQI